MVAGAEYGAAREESGGLSPSVGIGALRLELRPLGTMLVGAENDPDAAKRRSSRLRPVLDCLDELALGVDDDDG
jgi:hypothetical protein